MMRWGRMRSAQTPPARVHARRAAIVTARTRPSSLALPPPATTATASAVGPNAAPNHHRPWPLASRVNQRRCAEPWLWSRSMVNDISTSSNYLSSNFQMVCRSATLGAMAAERDWVDQQVERWRRPFTGFDPEVEGAIVRIGAINRQIKRANVA